MDFGDAAASLVDALGETYVYFGADGMVEIKGVPSSGGVRVNGQRGPAVSTRRAELQILKSQVATPREGDKLFRGTLTEFTGIFDFDVISVQPDDEDTVSTLVLKRCPE